MVRRLLVLLALATPLFASSRWLTDRAGAPVKWEGWGAAAFARAKKENKPIFLSIGFASSWECQRMQREAFLNGENVEALNAYFVPVVLDRIEYPEIARAYERIANVPGWPVNLILTPALEPFASGGFMNGEELGRMLVINANRWAHEREKVIAEAHRTAAPASRAVMDVDAATLDATLDTIAKTYDKEHGGFGEVPRTPHPMTLAFLQRYASRMKLEGIRGVTRDTLLLLARRPVRDQLGGGFHRATRDADWREPYFEKMLPDQALLAMVYLEAWQLEHDAEFERVVRTTLDYVLRDLKRAGPNPFDASQDAHNLIPAAGPEFANGSFYRWDTDEITRLVGEPTAKKIFALYGTGTLPMRDKPVDPDLDAALAKILDVRQKRPAPFREGNLIAGWNGLAISALARAGAVLGDEHYIDAAAAAMRGVTKALWNAPKKTLSRADGVEALAEDYALLVEAALDLFDAQYDPVWLDLAITLQQRQDQLFWDASAGRYTTGASVPESLRAFFVEDDSEIPSANAVSASNLLRLAALTGNATWRDRPAMIFTAFGARLRGEGDRHAALASAFEDSLRTRRIVVVTGDPRKKETHDLLLASHERFEPERAVVFVPAKGAARDRMVRALPFTGALGSDPEQPIAYVCANGECRKQ